jgi:hypothetical protein
VCGPVHSFWGCGAVVGWCTLESSAKGNGPEATREGEYEMMSSTEIQVGLSNILSRFGDSLSTAERDALYEALDGVASGLFDDRS